MNDRHQNDRNPFCTVTNRTTTQLKKRAHNAFRQSTAPAEMGTTRLERVVCALKFSPSEQHLVAVSGDEKHTLFLFSMHTGQILLSRSVSRTLAPAIQSLRRLATAGRGCCARTAW